jgi:hypothetical protein
MAPSQDRGTLETTIPAVRQLFKNQFRAALAMLGQAVERCPEDLWIDGALPERLLACRLPRALLCAPLSAAAARGLPPLDKAPRWVSVHGHDTHAASRPPRIEAPYTKAEILEYHALCAAMVEPALEGLDLTSPESGFWWYKMPKLEHLLVNLRHIQHHAAQLADRLRNHAGVGVDWAASGS